MKMLLTTLSEAAKLVVLIGLVWAVLVLVAATAEAQSPYTVNPGGVYNPYQQSQQIQHNYQQQRRDQSLRSIEYQIRHQGQQPGITIIRPTRKVRRTTRSGGASFHTDQNGSLTICVDGPLGVSCY